MNNEIPHPGDPLSAPSGPPQAGPIEGFSSDEAIAARTSCTTFQVQKLIREGHLRQVSATATQRFFRTSDLDGAKAYSQRLLDIVGARQAVKHLSGSERERMFFSLIAAQENGRTTPNKSDFKEGERRLALAAKLDAQADRITARIDQVLERIDHVGRRPAAGRLQLSAVDTQGGVLIGAVVMQANLPLTGKTVFVDETGAVTKDPKAARRKLPVYSDAKTLETLLAACQDAGGKLRVRVDHDDSVQSRAGFATAFRKDGDVVRADVTLFDAFEGRDLVLETADRTPDLMGLSVDIVPTFEIAGDRAFLRIQSISAVDVVDEGAGTPGGFFSES